MMLLNRPKPLAGDLLALALDWNPGGPPGSGGDHSAVRRRIAEFLDEVELINLATIGEHGWPVTHCMHFASYAMEGDRPIIYMFTHDGKRKLDNVAANPRVAVTAFNPRHDIGGRLPYLQLNGVARLATDPSERELAMQGQFNKVHYEFARHIGLETQPAMRVDVVSARWISGVEGEPAVLVDYRTDMGVRS